MHLLEDSMIINEIIIDESTIKEETNGNFLITFKEWESVTNIEGDDVTPSKYWTNLFCIRMKGVFVCVLFELNNTKETNVKWETK